jgi:hypothetical protein
MHSLELYMTPTRDQATFTRNGYVVQSRGVIDTAYRDNVAAAPKERADRYTSWLVS